MSDYDAFRKVINHEANQDDDGGFFTKLGGIQPGHDDGPTSKGLFQHRDVERGGPAFKWPARGGVPPGYFNRNPYAYQYEPEIMPKKSAIDYLIEAFKAPFNQKPKRNPYMTIRRLSSYGGNFGTHRVWCVHCTKCEIPGTKKTLIFAKTSTWQEAITAATHHAHNHHGSQ